MNLALNLVLWVLVAVVGIAVLIRSKSQFREAAENGLRDFLQLIPRIAVGMIGSGYLAEAMPQQYVADLLGPGSGTLGITVAALAGGLTPGGPMIGFALAATALKAGAGTPQVISYSVAWALFALHRIFLYEIPVMPPRVVWLRVLVSLPLPFLAAALALAVGQP